MLLLIGSSQKTLKTPPPTAAKPRSLSQSGRHQPQSLEPPPVSPRRQSLSTKNPPLPPRVSKSTIKVPPPVPPRRQANSLPNTKPHQSQVSSPAPLTPQLDPTAIQQQEEMKDQSSCKPMEGSLEYITIKEMLADLVDLLAGNAPVISQLNNHLFSSDLIPKAVHVTVETTGLTPYDRSNKIFSSVLATLECHSNPNSVFSSLITALQKVRLNNMASKLMNNLSKIQYYNN